jgi:hypothetical protein
MSTYTCRKAGQKYAKQWERAVHQLSNNTPISELKQIRKYQERKKLEVAQCAADGSSTSLVAAVVTHKPMNVNDVSD